MLGVVPAPQRDRDHSPRAERRALAREAERRRRAAELLRVVAAVAAYASEQAGNGLPPEQARLAVVEAAGELEAAAGQLRGLVRLRLHERQAMARYLTTRGLARPEVAARVGISVRAVRYYVDHHRACP
jgi:predicted transcriptional regulator